MKASAAQPEPIAASVPAPSVTIDEIAQGIKDIQQGQAPKVAQNLRVSEKVKPVVPQSPETKKLVNLQAEPMPIQNPKVMEHVAKKILGDDYSPEKLQEAMNQAKERKSGLGWLQFASGLGDAIAGRNPAQSAQVFDSIRKGIDDETVGAFDKKRKAAMENQSFEAQQKKLNSEAELTDPNSKASQAFRQSIEANFPRIAQSMGSKWAEVSAADQQLIFKPLELKEQIEARKQTAAILAESRRDALNLKHDEKNQKQKQTMFEIEDRRQNINAALDQLDKMIDANGTWEAFGSHNQDMDRLIEQVATDMAKLQDPNSVARPQEVEAVKKTLVQPGFKNSNKTARDVLRNFKGEVARRADGAYKIRGLEAPAQSSSAQWPKTVRKGNQTAQVSNAEELKEAQSEGWQ